MWTGLRVSELIGLKWPCILTDSSTIEEGFCRGGWATPKTDAAPRRLEYSRKSLPAAAPTHAHRGSGAVRRHKLVKSGGPDDLVFQSVQNGSPMNNQNILERHIQRRPEKPAYRSSTGAASEPRLQPGCYRREPTRNRCKAECGTPAFRPR